MGSSDADDPTVRCHKHNGDCQWRYKMRDNGARPILIDGLLVIATAKPKHDFESVVCALHTPTPATAVNHRDATTSSLLVSIDERL